MQLRISISPCEGKLTTIYVLNAAAKAIDVVDALRECGHEAHVTADGALLKAGDVALVIGFDSWGSPAAKRFLEIAGDRGAIRVVWQIEPLLPPVTSVGAGPIVSRLLSRRWSAKDLVGRRRHSLKDMVHCQRLAWACRGEPWGQNFSSGHMFKVPLQQTRCLLAYWQAGLIDHCLVSLVPRQQFLERLDIPSRFVPFGYVPEFGRWLGEQPRDIDVLFLGRLSSRRRTQLRQLEKKLRAAGFNLKVVSRNCYGDERTRLLNRTKILLNVHKFPWEFPGIRLLMGMSCRALVVSEPAPDIKPYQDGVHLVLSPAEQLGETLIKCLQSPSRREAITERAYQFATIEMAMGTRLARALSDLTHSRIGGIV
jgi:hypothetical protein